jgi:hypothetical protein
MNVHIIYSLIQEKFFELDVLFSIVSVEVSDKGSGGLKKDHRADFFVVCKVDVKVPAFTYLINHMQIHDKQMYAWIVFISIFR